MDVRQILINYLKENKFDGLYSDDCGCELSDLAPCGNICDFCEAGYKIEYDEDYDCGCDAVGTKHFHIGPISKSLKDHLEDAKNWICDCGQRYNSDGSWRWNGMEWEHKCDNDFPQAGHFVARRVEIVKER